MPVKVKFDDSGLQAKLRDLSKWKNLTFAEILRRHARLCAVELCSRTQPFGKSAAVRQTSERAIERDIRKLYRDHAAVLAMVRNWKDTPWQRAVVKALETEDFNALWILLQETNSWLRDRIVEQPSAATHGRFRNRRGRVSSGRYFEIVKNAAALAKYIKDRQTMVGFTKSVWWSAVQQLKTDLKRATDGFPAWVRRHKAPGRAHDMANASTNPMVILTASLPWMDQVLPSYERDAAVRIVKEKMLKYIEYTWKGELRRMMSSNRKLTRAA